MLILGIILLVIGAVLMLARGLQPPAATIGLILAAIGAVLILVAIVDVSDDNVHAALLGGALFSPARLGKLG